MPDRHDAKPTILWIACLMTILLWFWGCSIVGTKPEQERPKQWFCDKDADAAVNREDWEIALSLHLALLESEPENCLAIYHLGYIHGKLGDRRQETRLYEKAIGCGLDTDDRLYFNLGMAYGEMNQFDEALSAFERAVSVNDRNAENYFGLGLIATWAAQVHRAEAALVQAVDLDPRHWEARMLLTRIYLDAGWLDAAQPHLDYLLDHVPENDDVEELRQIYEDRRITVFD